MSGRHGPPPSGHLKQGTRPSSKWVPPESPVSYRDGLLARQGRGLHCLPCSLAESYRAMWHVCIDPDGLAIADQGQMIRAIRSLP